MRYAVQIELADRNPVMAIKPFEIEGDGHHSWLESEIEQYENQYPIGTQARLILDLFLFTGQRLGDVHTLGPRHYQDGRLEFYQEKRKGKVFMSIPMLAPLAETILASQTGKFCFIISRKGTAYTSQSLGNLVRKYCREAGLHHCSAHGLRKAAARRLAVSGATNAEIKSWTGHTTDSEVARYTKGASNILLSDAAADKLLANLANGLDKKSSNQLKERD